MRKMFFLMLSLMILSVASVKAQVTIGNDADPHPGAVLDLKGNTTTGFLMPRVYLTDVVQWAPVGGDPEEGMMVFNVSESIASGLDGMGIYVWVKGSWNKMGASAKPCTEVKAEASTNQNFFGF